MRLRITNNTRERSRSSRSEDAATRCWLVFSVCAFACIGSGSPIVASEPGPQQTAQPPAAQANPGVTAQSSGKAAEEAPNDLFLNVGKSVLVDSSVPIERVSVGFGEVAEASAVTPQEVLVNGKAPGQTSLIIWQQGGGKLFFDVTVQPSHYTNDTRVETLRREMSKELPGSKIDATVEGDLVFLRGSVKSLTEANRAVTIASAMGKPVNLLYVNIPPPEAEILLKVKFASVDRSKSLQLGANLFNLGAGNTVAGTTSGQFPAPTIAGGSSGTTGSAGGSSSGGGISGKLATATISDALNVLIFRPDLNLGATIEALEARGLVEVLAEPNVLAQNGKQASFLAGGEFPYPIVQAGTGTTAVTIAFRQFGVRLNFIPTITPRGTIRLQVAPEVSSLDYSSGVTISGFTVPGISIRNVNTEVELAEGQSFAISGLLDNRESETFNKIPFIGDIPILGKLFQSKTTSRTNTELMVIVTPELVRPIPAGQPLPSLKFPVSFLPPNTPGEMSHPGQNVTGPVPVVPPTPTMPVETLVNSMQAEKPLVVNSSTTGQTLPVGATPEAVPAPAAPQNPAAAPAPATAPAPGAPAPATGVPPH